jgi:hypothetical protein
MSDAEFGLLLVIVSVGLGILTRFLKKKGYIDKVEEVGEDLIDIVLSSVDLEGEEFEDLKGAILALGKEQRNSHLMKFNEKNKTNVGTVNEAVAVFLSKQWNKVFPTKKLEQEQMQIFVNLTIIKVKDMFKD